LYALSPYVASWTGAYTGKVGSDTNANTLTIDNESPSNASSTSGSAGNAAVTLNWTASSSSDISYTVILRWATTQGSEVPVEGTSYTAGNTISTATVACVLTSTASQSHSGIVDGTGGTTGCTTSALTNGTDYYYRVFSFDSRSNYDAGVNFTGSPFRPISSATYSGTIYSDDGSTVYNCSTNNLTVALRVNGAGTYTTTCTAAGGTYSIGSVTVAATNVVTIFINDETSPVVKGATVTRAAGTGNVTGLNLYQNRVIVRHEDAGPISASDLNAYDSGNDADIPFTVSTNLTVLSGTKLIVWTGKTFTPAAAVTTTASSSASGPDGDLWIQSGATFNINVALEVGGDFKNEGTFTEAGAPQITTFTATATGHTIDNGTGDLDSVVFNGTGGGWSFTDASNTIAGDMVVTAGTLSGTTNLTVSGGQVTGAGTINLTGGTFTLLGTSNGSADFGGTPDWTFYNLTIGGATNTTYYATGAGKITVSNVLTIDTSDTLNAGAKTYDLTGSGTPFVINGTFTAGTSTVAYKGTSATNITAATYYNLSLIPAATVTYTLGTAGSQTIRTDGTFTIGNGTNVVTVNHATYDPTLDIRGDLTIAANAVFTKSDAGVYNVIFNKGGAQTYTDNTGASGGDQDLGWVKISINGSNNTTLNQGSRTRFTKLTIDSGQIFNHNDRVYITGSGTGASRPFVVNGTYTLQSYDPRIHFESGAATSIEAVSYNSLYLAATTPITFTLGTNTGQTLTAYWLQFNGSSTIDADTYDPDIVVGMALRIYNNTTFQKGSGMMIFKNLLEHTVDIIDYSTTPVDIGNARISANGGTNTQLLLNGTTQKFTTLTIDANQTFDFVDANTLTLTGNGSSVLVNNGTITLRTGTMEFAPSATTGVTVPARAYYNLRLDKAGNEFTVSSGTLTANNLELVAGTLNLNTNDPTVTVANLTNNGTVSASNANNLTFSGNFTNNGTFTHNNGTVVLATPYNGVSIIGGSADSTFYNLTGNTMYLRTLQFASSRNYRFDGTLTLTGAFNDPVFIESTTSGQQWIMNMQGTHNVQYARLSNMGCHASSNFMYFNEWTQNGGNNSFSCMWITVRGGGVVFYSTDGGTGSTGGETGGDLDGGDDATDGGTGSTGGTTGGTTGGGGGATP
jgi:hypothetical protein